MTRPPPRSPPAQPGSGRFPPVAVEARDLACQRGGRAVFADLCFSVPAGALLAVTGPNGAGKTSLLRVIAGLIRPAAGALAVGGGVDGERPPTHFLAHWDGLKPPLTLRETLRFWAALYGVPATRADIPGAADRVGLAHAMDLPVSVLSAGQRRRAGLARLMLAPRPLWLLDEPTAALDRDGEVLLGDLIAGHLGAGGTIVAATHQPLPVAAHAELAMGASA